MSGTVPLTEHLHPDSIGRLERAAELRVSDADCLSGRARRLSALYHLGYAVEMCLAAAVFRTMGFPATMTIDRETRNRRMAFARQTRGQDGEPLMSGDPHPIVGWARYLEHQRVHSGNLSNQVRTRLVDAVRRAKTVYRHWRPELRYKVTEVREDQLAEVRGAAAWFLQHRGRF